MTYVINITGSKQTSSDDESREFEQGIVDKAREFVSDPAFKERGRYSKRNREHARLLRREWS